MNSFLFLIIFQFTSSPFQFFKMNDFLMPYCISQDYREKKAIDKLLKLPEVILKSNYIDSITRHKNGISILVVKKPSTKNGYYWLQAGYDNTIRFEVIYNFYVYMPAYTIKYFDPIENKVLTLSEWRRLKK